MPICSMFLRSKAGIVTIICSTATPTTNRICKSKAHPSALFAARSSIPESPSNSRKQLRTIWAKKVPFHSSKIFKSEMRGNRFDSIFGSSAIQQKEAERFLHRLPMPKFSPAARHRSVQRRKMMRNWINICARLLSPDAKVQISIRSLSPLTNRSTDFHGFTISEHVLRMDGSGFRSAIPADGITSRWCGATMNPDPQPSTLQKANLKPMERMQLSDSIGMTRSFPHIWLKEINSNSETSISTGPASSQERSNRSSVRKPGRLRLNFRSEFQSEMPMHSLSDFPTVRSAPFRLHM